MRAEQSRAEQSRAEQSRASNYELLRIVAMLMIIAYHYVIHGELEVVKNDSFFQKVFLEEFSMFGKIGVNLFVMLSGYFGLKKSFSIKKLVRLEIQILFFSWMGVFLGLFFQDNISLKDVVKMSLPTLFNQYWFMTAYIVLYLLSPWYNKALNSLTQKEYKVLLLMMTFIWGVIPCLILNCEGGMNFSQQIWMFVVYAYGAYFAKYKSVSQTAELYKKLLFFLSLLISSVILLELLSLKIPLFSGHATFFRWSNTILAFPLSVLIFKSFSNMRFNSIIINGLGGASLSVYLLHENPIVSIMLWNKLCKPWNGVNLVIFSFIIIIAVYMLGWAAHQIYKIIDKLVAIPIERGVAKVFTKLKYLGEHTMDRLMGN